MSNHVYGISTALFPVEKWMPNRIMEAKIVCPECKEEITRNQCNVDETNHDDLVKVTFQIVDKIALGKNYYCPNCGTFLRHDVSYIEL